jgi:hypothetical protein
MDNSIVSYFCSATVMKIRRKCLLNRFPAVQSGQSWIALGFDVRPSGRPYAPDDVAYARVQLNGGVELSGIVYVPNPAVLYQMAVALRKDAVARNADGRPSA